MLYNALLQALRTVRRNARRSLISIFATALGVAFTLLMLGVADGVYKQLIRDATRMTSGHVTVQNPNYLETARIEDFLERGSLLMRELKSLKGVEQVKPQVLGEALVRSGVDATGAAVMAVDPAAERASSPIAEKLVGGEFLRESDQEMALIGVDMADRLDLDVGSKFVISANDVHGELTAQLLHVRGIFRTGEASMDGYAVMMPISAARSLYSLPATAVTRLALVLEDADDEYAVLARAERLAKRVGGKAYPWQTIQAALAGYIRLDRGSGLVSAFILIGISLFTIFNTVLMSVLERRREIAVRFALGTPRTSIALQLLFECLSYGILGCALGTAIAVAVLWPFVESGMDLTNLYGGHSVDVASFAISTVVHPDIDPATIGVICGIVLATTALTAAPAFAFLARLSIVEELRA